MGLSALLHMIEDGGCKLGPGGCNLPVTKCDRIHVVREKTDGVLGEDKADSAGSVGSVSPACMNHMASAAPQISAGTALCSNVFISLSMILNFPIHLKSLLHS
jgi:hypothetical protein